jgi:hypothetical protein
MACPLSFKVEGLRTVFWLCKGSIIISSLTVIWYEWLGETWAVLELWMFLLNLVSELKFLNVFMGQEDPIEFNIWLYLCFLFVLFLWACLSVLLGWWEEFS